MTLKLHSGVHAIVPMDHDLNNAPRDGTLFLLILKEPADLGDYGPESTRAVLANIEAMSDGSPLWVGFVGRAVATPFDEIDANTVGWAPLDPFLRFTS